MWHNLGSESLDDEHLAKLAADPKISAKAEAFTVAIEREAAEQRDAIAALFGTAKPATSRGWAAESWVHLSERAGVRLSEHALRLPPTAPVLT